MVFLQGDYCLCNIRSVKWRQSEWAILTPDREFDRADTRI
jgi:hypothetical protein